MSGHAPILKRNVESHPDLDAVSIPGHVKYIWDMVTVIAMVIAEVHRLHCMGNVVCLCILCVCRLCVCVCVHRMSGWFVSP